MNQAHRIESELIPVTRWLRSIKGTRQTSGAVLAPLMLLAPMMALILALFIGPLLQAAAASVGADQGEFSFAHYLYFLNSEGYRNDLWFTLAIGLGTVLACTALSLPLALQMRRNFRGKGLLWLLILLPLVTPHIIAAYALRLTLSPTSPFLFWLPQGGNSGIALVNAWPGLLVALTWKLFPVMLLNLIAALQGLPPGYEEAARDLGAGPWHRLRSILLPLIAPGWLAGATLVLILAISQFTITLIVYGGQKVTTIPLDVYFEAFSSHNPGLAAALGLVLMAITLVLVSLTTWWVRRRMQKWASTGAGMAGLGVRAQASEIDPSGYSLGAIISIAGLALIVLGPVVCLILYSFSDQWIGGTPFPSSFTLRWYDYIFRYESGLSALGQSTAIAFATAALTTLIAVPAAFALARYQFWGREFLESIFLAKSATPIIVIGVGTAALFYRWHWTDTFQGIVLAHSVGALPLIVRSATAAFERADRSQEEAARDLGAGSFRCFWQIILPVAMTGIMGGAVLSFLFSMDEFTVTFLISGVKFATLPLRLYSSLNQGYIEPAAATAVILLVPSLLYMGLLIKFVGTERLGGELSAG